MSTNTPNYNLEKPNEEEFYDVNVQNGNMDKIDSALKTLAVEVASGVSQEDLTAIDTKLDGINQGVDEINGKSDQIKQGVDNISAQIANANTKLDKLGNTVGTAIFDTNGSYSWTCPDGVRKVWLTIFGGGGGGGGGGANTASVGGGGGAYIYRLATNVVPGNGYPIVVGNGGSGAPSMGASQSVNAGAGGTSSAMGFSCLGGWGAQYIAGSQNHLPGRGGASTSWYSVRGADGGGGIANQSGGNGGKGLVIIEW
ncbi:glycine-rich domain-containing protein [Lysinibacillus sp. FSL M8-0337]|uniref:glycine-rich domain-containing protein n=2 Tax=Lysinibacillus TaxID=400634 RepID=UPI00315AD302